MSNKKFDFSKLKKLGSMDIKDIVNLIKKDKKSIWSEKLLSKKVKHKNK